MLRHVLLVPVLLGSCVAATAADLPGQQGPTTALLQGGPLQLSTRRTAELFPDGNRIWKVELHRGPRSVGQLASGQWCGPASEC